MIAQLSGKLIHKSPEYSIIDVNGVGYRVFTPFSTFYELPDIENQVTLHTYTNVREDALQLFGFLTTDEKEIFQLLISVSGIGPKLAVNILSGITPEELKGALLSGNLVRLTAIPGIGKKTAERMVLELRDKVLKLHKEKPGVQAKPVLTSDEVLEDAISALVNLGYKRPQAEGALEKVRKENPDSDIEEMIRGALKILAR
ncbi:MAG: Holliday junction branch migration protein RuvA [Deltaproteobacteria bacterium]|nr:Holliday junction branch migration protein RuvA [Deltaproteobacteria bacterium]